MNRFAYALPAALALSACIGASAFSTGRPATEQDYRPIGELQYGLDLAGADVALAARVDMTVARDTAVGPVIEAAVVAEAADGDDAVRRALRESETVWIFVTPRANEVVDVVFVLEGTAAEALHQHARTMRSNQYPRMENGVTEYVVGDLQIGIRAPDTLVLGASHDSRGHRGSVWDWTDWADRLRGSARAEPKPDITALRDALGEADAPIWAAARWTPALDAIVRGPLTEPPSAERASLISRIEGVAFAVRPSEDGFRIHGVARGRDPDLAAALADALPGTMPMLMALLPGLATRAAAPDLHATVTLGPEAFARVVQARFGD